MLAAKPVTVKQGSPMLSCKGLRYFDNSRIAPQRRDRKHGIRAEGEVRRGRPPVLLCSSRALTRLRSAGAISQSKHNALLKLKKHPRNEEPKRSLRLPLENSTRAGQACCAPSLVFFTATNLGHAVAIMPLQEPSTPPAQRVSHFGRLATNPLHAPS